MDNKANRQRNIQKKFFVSELENKIIEKRSHVDVNDIIRQLKA